jgi:exoribonuclease-2
MLPDHSLVLYRNRPAIVRGTTDRISILLEDGSEVRVRPKDVTLLHPGPVKGFAELETASGEIVEAWEILATATQEVPATLRDLADLAWGAYSPATAWAAWRVVADGTYFDGDPDRISARGREEVERRIDTRRVEAEEKAARALFYEHVRASRTAPEDERFLREIEGVALSRSTRSRLLKDLERQDSPEGAHALLLELGVWTPARNPYPARVHAETEASSVPFVPVAPEGGRRDLTAMAAFAIDDEGTTTPDDAVSYQDGELWVHIADPGAAIASGSDLDTDARRRAETLHLPEKTIHMLPQGAIDAMGLGLRETTPALSVRLEMDSEGNALAREIVPSTVRVTRLTYEQAEVRMDEPPLSDIEAAVMTFRRRREERGAFTLVFPEVHITVDSGGTVSIEPLGRSRSRNTVQEAMVMTGQAVARFAAARGLSIPFSVQEGSSAAAELPGRDAPLSQLWAARRTLRRSIRTLAPGRHAGLGVEPYCQATSPLRRYLDLVVHHQVRSVLVSREPLSAEEVTRRIGEVDAAIPSLRQAETLSEKHWTLVYLMQNPTWTGEAVVVDQRGRNHTVIIPSLALETEVHSRKPVEPDGLVRLRVQEVRLPLLEVHFAVL